MDDDPYVKREQTKTKHEILRRYLLKFALIIGRYWDTLIYIDTFSGPWKNKSTDLSDTSFSIAIEELTNAKAIIKETFKRDVKICFFFVEKDKEAFKKLEAFTASYPNLQIELRNDYLENVYEDIVEFIKSQNNGVPFFFIDPTGWTGFPMKTLQLLLNFKNIDVLINFMSIHLQRFLTHPNKENERSVSELFGDENFLEKIYSKEENISSYATTKREEAAVELYLENLARKCDFPIVSRSLVLQPEKDQVYFNLVYATKNIKGLDVFKDAERLSMTETEKTRVRYVQARKHNPDESYLFGMEEFEPSMTDHYTTLRENYISKSKHDLTILLNSETVISFDKIIIETLKYPLVWKKDVIDWLQTLNKGNNKKIEFLGLKENERTPKILKKHRVKILKHDISFSDMNIT